MLFSSPSAFLRSSTPLLRPQLPFLASPSSFSSFRRHYASPSISSDQDHYQNLGVPPTATRKQIKDKFYEVNSHLSFPFEDRLTYSSWSLFSYQGNIIQMHLQLQV